MKYTHNLEDVCVRTFVWLAGDPTVEVGERCPHEWFQPQGLFEHQPPSGPWTCYAALAQKHHMRMSQYEQKTVRNRSISFFVKRLCKNSAESYKYTCNRCHLQSVELHMVETLVDKMTTYQHVSDLQRTWLQLEFLLISFAPPSMQHYCTFSIYASSILLIS